MVEWRGADWRRGGVECGVQRRRGEERTEERRGEERRGEERRGEERRGEERRGEERRGEERRGEERREGGGERRKFLFLIYFCRCHGQPPN